MRVIWVGAAFIALGLVCLRPAPAAEDDSKWKPYVEAGSEYVRTAEAAKNSRDRRDNIERAAGQFQAAIGIGQSKSNWRPIVLGADGYVRLVTVSTGNDRDTYADLAAGALDSAAKIARAKADPKGLREIVRVYQRLARISAGAKLKGIESKIQSIEREAEGMPEAAEPRR